jgi:hypothetical protein
MKALRINAATKPEVSAGDRDEKAGIKEAWSQDQSLEKVLGRGRECWAYS